MTVIERAILAEIHIESQTLKELCRSTQYPCRVVKESIDKLIAKKLARKTWGWRNGSGKKVIVYAGVADSQSISIGLGSGWDTPKNKTAWTNSNLVL